MKQYTAIYSTATIKGVQYSFKAEDVDAAIAFASYKFEQFPTLAILENTCEKANEGILIFLNGERVK